MWRGTARGRLVMASLGAGLAAGGVVTGTMIWIVSGLGSLVPAPAAIALMVVATVVAILRDFQAIELKLPERRVLVPRTVLEREPEWAAMRFGFELGLGFRTYLSATAPYLLLFSLLLSGASFGLFLAVGAGFGVGRLATPMSRYFSTDGDLWDGNLERRAATLRSATALGASIAALLLLTVGS